MVYPDWVVEMLVREKLFNWLVLEKGWYKKRCLSALCWRKVGLRKTVYPAWMGGNLFMRHGSEKLWSEESCLFGLSFSGTLVRRKVIYPA